MAASSRQSLRVLLLEDRSADAELIVHELKKAGFDPIWQRVDNQKEYLHALGSAPDLILADFNMPALSAPRAPRSCSGSRTPTSRSSSSPAASAKRPRLQVLKSGATDYLLKDRLGRLGDAVRRAIAERQRAQSKREADTLVDVTEARMRFALEASCVGTWESDVGDRCRSLVPDARGAARHAARHVWRHPRSLPPVHLSRGPAGGRSEHRARDARAHRLEHSLSHHVAGRHAALDQRRRTHVLRRRGTAGARGGHRSRRDRTALARGTVSPGAEDGGDRPAGRRHRARLQQPADGDSRLFHPDRGGAAPAARCSTICVKSGTPPIARRR